jgi:hypothetical protein
MALAAPSSHLVPDGGPVGPQPAAEPQVGPCWEYHLSQGGLPCPPTFGWHTAIDKLRVLKAQAGKEAMG